MSRAIESVPELWREWTQGLSSLPLIQSLGDTYDASWRPEQKERTFFSRRKVIIDHIRGKVSSSGRNVHSVIEELELVRSRGNMSLAKLGKVLNSSTIP